MQADLKHPTRSGMIPGSWQHHMKMQLFLKASKAYYVLSDAATNLLKYGRALRYIKLSMQCYGEDILLVSIITVFSHQLSKFFTFKI